MLSTALNEPLPEGRLGGELFLVPQPKIIAAIPAYNEEKYIGEVVRRARKYVHQVVVIDDGSTDRTAAVAEAAGAEIIRHEINRGKGCAVDTAFSMARHLKADILILLDGDLQHNPDEIPLLLKTLKEKEADMVVGSRFLKGNKIPKYRRLGQEVLNITTNFGSGIRLSDTQCGFRAFSRKAINSFTFTETGLAVESEMQFLAREKSLKVEEVPITTNYNNSIKRNPVAHGFGVLFRVLHLVHKKRPLLIYGPGVLVACIILLTILLSL
ncbi:Undecaprenyl-phosphate 4-deoxy-4-formamido-L-arabinose transferase [Moorella humiferrea]|uniref:glycosyltransferase family 2 protein n=1 Tax=Neomoorella humiferrea TaxID=676965 RepID=UPI0030D4DF71